ncbi:hypothetical protein B0J14DRAFT_25506 [Halenospora varia]|nr:hypothetical protein B0J14DRAFT_25506 [Halenospora varia]
MLLTTLLPISLFLATIHATPVPKDCTTTPPNCKDILLPISAAAENTLYPAYPNLTTSKAFLQYLGSLANATTSPLPVNGTWNISVTYCEPVVKVQGREDTIQLLLHGVAYTKSYWSGIGFQHPDFESEYSWTAHANSQGYATIAMDNLGNGDSSRPDPLNIVQSPLQLAIIRQIMISLRAGSLPSISKPFKKIIFGTHSYGSILGRALATVFPTSGADAYVLTATSNKLAGFGNVPATFQAASASVRDPKRYSILPNGYLSPSPEGLRQTVYSFDGDFDPRLLAFDQRGPHTFAIGELAAQRTATPSNFTGPVLVLTGRYDTIVCGTGNITNDIATRTGDCGVGPTSNPAGTRELFPVASPFDTYIPDHTGHDLTLHYSAPESFGAVHAWLESAGF